MFTDRFIKLPIKTFNVVEKELTGNENLCDAWVKINPLEIAEYGQTEDEDGNLIYTTVTMKGRDVGFKVYLSIEEFEKLLNGF